MSEIDTAIADVDDLYIPVDPPVGDDEFVDPCPDDFGTAGLDESGRHFFMIHLQCVHFGLEPNPIGQQDLLLCFHFFHPGLQRKQFLVCWLSEGESVAKQFDVLRDFNCIHLHFPESGLVVISRFAGR